MDGATELDTVGLSEDNCCVDGSAVTGEADDGATDDGATDDGKEDRAIDGFALTGAADGRIDGKANGDSDGRSTGFKLGKGDAVVRLANPIGTVQLGDTGCAHCLYGLLLHTAPGSQHTESSVQA